MNKQLFHQAGQFILGLVQVIIPLFGPCAEKILRTNMDMVAMDQLK